MPGSDFNGDGRDDILWSNIDTGYTSNWLGTANGGFIVNDGVALDPWAPGALLTIGDFNGDGRADTLWRSGSGEIFSSLTDPGGAFYFYWNAGFVAREPTGWQIVGAGDFNGDGSDDILLWNYFNASVTTWSATSGGGFIQNAASPIIPGSPSWEVAGVGDFNGDGRDDILWRNASTGAVSNWLATLSGSFVVNDSNALHQVSTDWFVAGVGDFNGDGRDDILWRNTNGALSNWLGTSTGGFAVNDANAFTIVSTDWHVAGTGDFNGDGRDDVLWRNDNGAFSDWLGTSTGGFVVNDAAAYAQVETSWVIGSTWDPWAY